MATRIESIQQVFSYLSENYGKDVSAMDSSLSSQERQAISDSIYPVRIPLNRIPKPKTPRRYSLPETKTISPICDSLNPTE